MKNYDVLILGAGSAGLTAYGKLRHHFEKIGMINHGPYGTTCARVGCMPSKLLIQVAEDVHRASELVSKGMLSGLGEVIGQNVMDYVREWRDRFVEKTNAPLVGLGENNISGRATFIDKNTVRVEDKTYTAEHIIVAVGSRPVVPEQWKALSDKIITSDQVFELKTLPARLAVIGLGPIGLELGQAFSRLGSAVYGFDLAQTISSISDPKVCANAISQISKEFPLSLGQSVKISKQNQQLVVSNSSKKARVDYVLVATGRRSYAIDMGFDKLGIELDNRGIPLVDVHSLNIPNTNIYIVGDANTFRPILHEASDEGRMVSESIIKKQVLSFKRKTPMGISFTSPNIVFVGKKFSELEEDKILIGEDLFQMGRNKVIGESGIIRVYASKEGHLLGAEMIGPKAENLAHFLALAIEHNLTVKNLLESPFYHPTVEESLRNALRGIAAQIDQNLTAEVCCLE